jgi:hypothetical protein
VASEEEFDHWHRALMFCLLHGQMEPCDFGSGEMWPGLPKCTECLTGKDTIDQIKEAGFATPEDVLARREEFDAWADNLPNLKILRERGQA